MPSAFLLPLPVIKVRLQKGPLISPVHANQSRRVHEDMRYSSCSLNTELSLQITQQISKCHASLSSFPAVLRTQTLNTTLHPRGHSRESCLIRDPAFLAHQSATGHPSRRSPPTSSTHPWKLRWQSGTHAHTTSDLLLYGVPSRRTKVPSTRNRPVEVACKTKHYLYRSTSTCARAQHSAVLGDWQPGCAS